MSKRKANDDSVHNEKQKPKRSLSPSKPHAVFVVLYKYDPQSYGGEARRCDVKRVFADIAEANKEAIAAGNDLRDSKKAERSKDTLAIYAPDDYGVEIWITKTGDRMIEMKEGNGDGRHSVSAQRHLVKERSELTPAV
ncbi:hypothetical protein LTR37_007218 [Vermiconidia calcicola]|uniref:Uncharacterized protein n=1 Tax=Vermiconidia calcicola TaxID=1690605 RepID=A0ACC3NEU3_9PEZI|nr:hypothetical protein LTR37_007218 [Vermiconidia calcicola]